MKKFTALLLIFSLIEISCASITSPTVGRRFPERKQGAIVITKTDGQQIEGELIAVKQNSLLLLDTVGKDMSINIADIKVIRIVKKSKAWLGAGIGLLTVGGGAVLACGTGLVYTEEGEEWGYGLLYGVLYGVPAAILGGIIGAGLGKDKTIQIEGMPDLYIQETLDKLRKKARIRDYK